jgi:hypothetical protein
MRLARKGFSPNSSAINLNMDEAFWNEREEVIAESSFQTVY